MSIVGIAEGAINVGKTSDRMSTQLNWCVAVVQRVYTS